jgi:hypothetical protein
MVRRLWTLVFRMRTGRSSYRRRWWMTMMMMMSSYSRIMMRRLKVVVVRMTRRMGMMAKGRSKDRLRVRTNL